MLIARYSVALMAAVVCAYIVWHWARMPPLVRGPDKEFGARVQAKFPIGMTEADLVRELHDQGFGPAVQARDLFFKNSATGEKKRIRAQDTSLRYSTFSSFSFPCDVTWWVLWHSDQEARVADVRGTVGGSCL